MEAGGGIALDGDRSGPFLALDTRLSTVIHLAEVRAGYRFADAGTPVHQLRVSAQAHPLFLFLIVDDTWGAALSALYVSVGAGPWIADGLQFGWDWGAGIDVPLSNLSAEQSWWLGLEWNRGCTPTGGPYEHTTLTTVGLRLGFRAHGL